MPIPRATVATPPPVAQPTVNQQSIGNTVVQHQRNCPKCGATIDHELGRCSGCGLLYGVKNRVMPSPTAPVTPAPRPTASWPQGSMGQHPQAAQAVRPQYNNPRPSLPTPSLGQRPNYLSPGVAPQGGMLMPIPSVAPVTVGAASASVPMSPKPYRYQTAPSASVARGIPASGNRGLKGVITTAFIIVVLFLVGSGIYFFINRMGTAAIVDKTAPTISGVNVSNITESSAIVTWTTNEPATSQVKYEKTEKISSTTSIDKNLNTNHSVKIAKLASATTYNCSVISRDAAGNEAVSATKQTFKTLTPIPVGTQVGNRAPDFALKDLSGKDVKLSDFRGKTVMINFWAVWCDPCVKELPFIQNVSGERSSKGLVVLAIAVKSNEQLDTVKQYITQKSYTFSVLFDAPGQAESLYKVSTLPTTFFIDTEGIIRKMQVGSFEGQSAIENILDSIK